MKSFGAALVFTEMVSANGLIRDGRKTRELLASCPEEEPLAIQLFGDDPQILARAAVMVAGHGALLDINMGCPVKKVIRSGAGSALLREPQRIGRIIAAVRTVHSGPLSIKIRSGWDQDSVNYREIGRIAEAEGADAVTLHPRTRSQVFGGQADWEQIADLKMALNIPVFGSGDIFQATDGVRMLQQTGCDGIMIGRGGFGNPWLIRDILARLTGEEPRPPEPAEIFQLARHHLQLHREQFGDHQALLEMRKHFSWYLRGLPGASRFRAGLQQIDSIDQLLNRLEGFFSEACH
jgi:nifR3 family TIM-barrel protein